LQLAVAKILEAIYEQDFLGCSYGYRPPTGAHKAVKDLSQALMFGRYHYLVEADIKGFFNNIDHDLLIEMLEKRVDDKAFLNLIRKWLKAGILDEGQVICPITGTPQAVVWYRQFWLIFIFTRCWMSGFMKQYKRIAEDRFIFVVMRMILFVLLNMKKMRSVSTKP
jgi:Reverse transcriptase (RNA-dependent DNA polymerase)